MRLNEHRVERLLPRSFCELGEERDVAATNSLKCCPECSEYRSRSDDDSAYDTKIVDDPEPGNVERGRRHVGWNILRLRMDDRRHV